MFMPGTTPGSHTTHSLWHSPIKVVVEPALKGFGQGCGWFCVAYDGMVQALPQCVQNELRHCKVHVGYPERQNIPPGVLFPLGAVGAATINQLLKVAHAQGQPVAGW